MAQSFEMPHHADGVTELPSGKDRRLRSLLGRISDVVIDGGVTINRSEWDENSERSLKRIVGRYGRRAVIVRSCAADEDTEVSTAAGRYATVVARTPKELPAALKSVFESYGNTSVAARVFVQAFVHPVDVAAVVTSSTLSGNPYQVVSLDSASGKTDGVTSGRHPVETWLVHRRREATSERCVPDEVSRILRVLHKVEDAEGRRALDLEVALTGQVAHLFQVRSLPGIKTSEVGSSGVDPADVVRALELRSRERSLVLSNMADWNPAEMIGRRPTRLARSLYEVLITDQTWAEQRAAFGYRDKRGHPLLVDVADHAFVDVLTSIESFIPAAIPNDVAEVLLHHGCSVLAENPDRHDELEFSVIRTCWSPGPPDRRDIGLPSDVVRVRDGALLKLTRNALDRFETDFGSLEKLRMPSSEGNKDLQSVLRVARQCALIFAHLARHAFIAVDIVRGLRRAGVAIDVERWLRRTSDSTNRLHADAYAVRIGALARATFVERYSWLRPGTYDLRAQRYGADPERYLDPVIEIARPPVPSTIEPPWSAADVHYVAEELRLLCCPPGTVAQYLRRAIAGRERAKHVYASWVGAALEIVEDWCQEAGVPDEMRQHLDVREAGTLTIDLDRLWDRRQVSKALEQIELPDVVLDPLDALAFARRPSSATFVGVTPVEGAITTSPTVGPLRGRIVVVEAADPGYEWMFEMGIAGLVTAYGGANSHMAIRCSERGVPAALGIGLTMFERCKAASRISLDPSRGMLQWT